MPLIIINFIFKTFPKKGNLDQHLKIHNKEQKVTDSLPSHPLINLYLVLLILVVANSRGPRTAGRGAKYRGLPVRGPKSNSRGPRTSF